MSEETKKTAEAPEQEAKETEAAPQEAPETAAAPEKEAEAEPADAKKKDGWFNKKAREMDAVKGKARRSREERRTGQRPAAPDGSGVRELPQALHP
mgnify:FL=1